MEPYKEMYLKLFNAITDGIERLKAKNYEEAARILVAAQQAAEEIYMSAEDLPA